ncbi:MAG: hypothetical protein LBI47_01440 [Puniceicoccales bacterium]|nr:hypothetical protein [Puniceicoccales bacterium]
MTFENYNFLYGENFYIKTTKDNVQNTNRVNGHYAGDLAASSLNQMWGLYLHGVWIPTSI